jgi:D-xylose transport system substrate-binding protein
MGWFKSLDDRYNSQYVAGDNIHGDPGHSDTGTALDRRGGGAALGAVTTSNEGADRTMRKSFLAVAALGATLALGVTGCSSSSKSSSGGSGSSNTKVGILLPDTATSPRWVSADPTELRKECNQYKLDCTIDNANGSASQMQTDAQAMINKGVGVILMTNLDPGSGKSIEDLAKAHNVVSIDYDRLTPGGDASYYVSFDGVAVGKAQGTALTQCPQVANKSKVNYVEIDGAATDNNATLFAQGYNSVLSTKPGWTKLADQSGNWDAAVSQTVFTTMLGQHHDINAVMVANDTMAQSVINVLQSQGLAGKVAVSGQDATAGGLDNVMQGTQCFTIYKPVPGEADVAIKLASQILKGQKPGAPTSVKDPTTGRQVPSFLATPTVITKSNVAQPVTDGYIKASAVCSSPALIKLCNDNGIKTS